MAKQLIEAVTAARSNKNKLKGLDAWEEHLSSLVSTAQPSEALPEVVSLLRAPCSLADDDFSQGQIGLNLVDSDPIRTLALRTISAQKSQLTHLTTLYGQLPIGSIPPAVERIRALLEQQEAVIKKRKPGFLRGFKSEKNLKLIQEFADIEVQKSSAIGELPTIE